ncbi:competence-damaged protein-domain-containing protein [Chaetomidium leptoderma]|uniref:Competence-damaged protein-domain-containing protein n=1 Tax=Chaetomidium leptoderma TaxID=669021 RepID=A0AAN6ZX48_9PEZI|nr:competence-damaged protein-domain-containing protein [Chaetomidium leptoderma]
MSTTTTPPPPNNNHTPALHKTTDPLTLADLATDVIHRLRSTNQILGVADAVFRGGIVSYATPLKQTLLGADAALIAREGVIHPEVALQMAEGARKATSIPTTPQGEDVTGWGIGTTGVAGPDQQDGKAVETVYIGIASPSESAAAAGGSSSRAWGPFSFPGSRQEVREATVMEALARLREALQAAEKTGE